MVQQGSASGLRVQLEMVSVGQDKRATGRGRCPEDIFLIFPVSLAGDVNFLGHTPTASAVALPHSDRP